jgi:hypothetical protein
MSGYILHLGAVVQCPHQAPAQVSPSNSQVKVSQQAVAVMSDQYQIAGCPFVIGPKSSPCLTIQWVKAASRVKVNGQPVLISDSKGLCLSPEQAPQGTPTITSTQTRVKAQ